MKKTIYGIVVAALGVVLGAGGMFFFGLMKPPQPTASAGAGAASPGAPASAAPGVSAAAAPGVSASASGATAAGKGSDAAVGKAGPAGAASPTAPAGTAAGAAPKGPGGGATVVEVAKPEKLTWPKTVTSVGSLRSDESVMVRAEQSGRITALNFKEGQMVRAGQLLVQLDDSLARAELEQAKANQKLGKAKFDRAVELQQKNFISGQARDEAENVMRVADATVSLAEAKLTKLFIKSPFSGTVGLRSASVGDYVKDGQDIVNLEKTDPIKVDFKVPEIFQSKIRVGQTLSVALDALPGKTYSGVVYALNPQLDAAGRALVLRAQMPNRSGDFKPGMFARVRLTIADSGVTIVVPEQAVAMQGEDQVMYKVVDGRALRTKVEVGQRREGKAEIIEGIGAGDTIVVAGWQKLRDGAAVRAAGGGQSAPAAAGMAGPTKGEGGKAPPSPPAAPMPAAAKG